MPKGILSLLNTTLCVCACACVCVCVCVCVSREHLETWINVWAWCNVWAWELLKENGGTEYKANQ